MLEPDSVPESRPDHARQEASSGSDPSLTEATSDGQVHAEVVEAGLPSQAEGAPSPPRSIARDRPRRVTRPPDRLIPGL